MDTSSPAIPVSAKISLLVACFFWAASFIASKVALQTVPALTVVSFRLVISAVCFLLWLGFSGKRIRVKEPAWWWKLFVLSLFGTGLHYGIQTIGIGYTTASNASVYAATGPVTITIIAALFLGERITWKKAAGIGCALIGVLIITGIDRILSFQLKGNVLGDFLVFSSVFIWGIFTVMGKDMTRQMSVLEITTVVTVMGALYMLPLGIIEMGRFSLDLFSITVEAWISIVFLGVTCSFLATLLYFHALDKTESQKVGVYLYTIPPMTVVIASIYLKEVIGFNLVIGTVAVLIGVILTEKG